MRVKIIEAAGWLAAALPLLLLVSCATGPGRQAECVVREQTADLRAFLTAELAAGHRRIVVPPGRYRVKPEGGRHLLFKGLANVEIDAAGVEMVCGATVQALGFEECRNVTLRGLTVDYDPLPFTQGGITGMAPDKSWLEFEVAAGYPENDLEARIEIFDPTTGELRRGDAGWETAIEALGAHRYRVRKRAGYRFDEQRDIERIGDILVTNNRFPAWAGGHAVVVARCTGLRLEDVTLYASPCFGFLEHDSSGSTYLRCRIDRRDPAADSAKRAQPRMRSLNADAFHSKNAEKGPAIIGCTARFQGDDCVNINGLYHYVSRTGPSGPAAERSASGAVPSRQLRMAVFGQPAIRIGDPVEFLPYAGPRPPDAVAVGIEPDPEPVTAAEKAFIAKLAMNENIRSGLLSGQARFFILTLDREVVLPAGSAVCSGRQAGNGFVVRDCDFGHNRSRGILIKASRGEVSGNRITNSRMAAVLVSPEFWWMEAACSSDVVIRGNIIRGCRQTPIQVMAPGGNGRPLPSGAHRAITISNNSFEDCPWPLIHVTSTDGLDIRDNKWPAIPPPESSQSRDGHPPVPVRLELCEHAETRQ